MGGIEDVSRLYASRVLDGSDCEPPEFHRIIERISDACIALDAEWRYTYVNDSAARIFDREPFEMIGQRVDAVFGAGDAESLLVAYQQAMATQRPVFFEEYCASCGRWFESRIFPSANGLTVLLGDITDRRSGVVELQRVNRALRVLTACNQALARSIEEKELLTNVCDVIVDLVGFRMAWVGYAMRDKERSVEPVAESGLDEGYLDAAHIVWADNERGQGPTGRAIRERRPIVLNDMTLDAAFEPWREQAEEKGFRSSVAIPMMEAGACIGALNVYSDSPSAFSGEELQLLCQLAADLAYGLSSIRARRPEVVLEEKSRELGMLLKSSRWPPDEPLFDIAE